MLGEEGRLKETELRWVHIPPWQRCNALQCTNNTIAYCARQGSAMPEYNCNALQCNKPCRNQNGTTHHFRRRFRPNLVDFGPKAKNSIASDPTSCLLPASLLPSDGRTAKQTNKRKNCGPLNFLLHCHSNASNVIEGRYSMSIQAHGD